MIMRTSGFTLIELMITLAIFAFLTFLAGPMYADFMGNTQIRTAAENTLTGVRLAQTSAVRNNRPAKFVLDTTSVTGGWAVYPWDENAGDFDPVAVEKYSWIEGASKTTATPTPAGATEVTFDGLGRVVTNLDATASLTRVDVTNTSVVATPRKLSVLISAAGGASATKLCDPLVLATDPRSC
jgi:type IV fimbrial biogenesis protein FimT